MKLYPAYKNSGVEWIGDIPQNWNSIKFRLIADIMTCGHAATPDYFDEGVIFLSAQNIRNEKLDIFKYNFISEELHKQLTKHRKVEKGDLLQVRVGGSSTIGQTCVVEIDNEFSIYVSLCHIRVNTKAFNYYVKYLCNSARFREQCSLEMKKGAGVANLNIADLEKYKIPLPPFPEQKQIAGYLDRKTKQIDTLIEKKQKLIKLLKEQRTAIINQAVTKGLDPNVPMKDSGIEWLGEMPRHWSLRKIKSELEFLDHQRIPLSAEVRGMMTERKYDYYGASGIIDKVDDYIFDEILILLGEDGANLLSRSTPLAFVAKGKYWVNNHAHILRPQRGNIDYFVNLLEALDYTTYVSGSAQPKLTSDNLKNIVIPIPTKNEQDEIAKFIKLQTVQIDTMTKKHDKSIELLKEYRTALVSEAVTGKIDVRHEVMNDCQTLH